MPLFEDLPRTDRVRLPGESIATFLASSSWERAVQSREAIERMFAALPAAEKPEFAARLRSTDDRLVHATFSELWFHDQLLKQGRTDVVIPPHEPGASRPDFVLADLGLHFEVHRLSGADTAYKGDRRRATVIDGLQKVHSPHFWLRVRMRVDVQPSIAKLRREIETWLSTLDPAAEQANYDARNFHRLSERVFQGNGWQITLGVVPPSPQAAPTPAVGTIEGGSILIHGYESIRDAIKKKMRQHGTLGSDLVIVLDMTEALVHEDEIEAALYGPQVDDRSGPQPTIYRRRSDGLWPTPSSATPAAVVTIEELRMAAPERAVLKLWVPPSGKHPAPSLRWATHQLR